MMKTNYSRICPETTSAILDRAFGNYRDILQYAGADERLLSKRAQACPWCGGKDRFCFTDKFGKGDSYCRHCGHHSGVDLLMHLKGFSYREALLYLADYFSIPVHEEKTAKPRRLETKPGDLLEKLWDSSHSIGKEDSAYAYLRSRGLGQSIPPALRASSSLLYKESEEGSEHEEVRFFEGLVAEISNAEGKRVNLHRTYLESGRKAAVRNAKKVLSKELSGCSIRLGDYGSDGVLGLAEGIETALSAAELFKVPVWSVVAAFNFKNFIPPKGVRKLILFADADLNFVGQKEAFAGAAAIKQKFPEVEVEVRIPDVRGSDWNDVLVAEQASSRTRGQLQGKEGGRHA